MSKKMIAMLLTLAMVLGCTGALAENAKHERVYVVTGADGTVKSITDSIRLENTDGLDQLTDRTMLRDIRNMSGEETFTLDGETITWNAGGKSVIYQGTSDKTPAVLPVVTLTLDGETVTAAELKEKTGEATLTVSCLTEGKAPALMISVLPLPEEGITDIRTENAVVITEMNHPVLIGLAVPGLDASLQLPASFSAAFHADHADLGWMMTFCSSDPLAAACRELDSRMDEDTTRMLTEIPQLLTALKDGESLPETEGKLREIADKITELNIGLTSLDAAAQQVASGAKQVSDGAASLRSGLSELTKSNDALNGGAQQIFDGILNSANEQLAASGLAEAGITLPALTAENYAETLDGILAMIGPDTVPGKLPQAQEACRKLTALKEQLDQVNTFVTGVKAYTDGASQALTGASELSAGAMMLNAGAGMLQKNGTATLKDQILGAEKDAAAKALTLMETHLNGALDIWKQMKEQLTDVGYDLRQEGMQAETVYIIRTDLR